MEQVEEIVRKAERLLERADPEAVAPDMRENYAILWEVASQLVEAVRQMSDRLDIIPDIMEAFRAVSRRLDELDPRKP